MIKISKTPKILDIDVLNIDLDKSRDIKVKILGTDPQPLKVIEVPDVYVDYIAVRELALEIPSVFAHNIDEMSGFPGWRGMMLLDQTPLYNFIENILSEHLCDEFGGNFKNKVVFPFGTGIVNTKSIIRRVSSKTNPLSSLYPHRDCNNIGMIAGSIYLNLPEECIGGTSFYDPTKKINETTLVHKVKMIPNTMVIYQQRIPHSITLDSIDDIRDHYRIAQNFFIDTNYYK